MIRKLAESAKYLINSEYETVYLNFNVASREKVVIGDFYGDPYSALITADESHVVMFGCGIIIYRLAPPFKSYSYNWKRKKQYAEFFREKKDLVWVKEAFQDKANPDLIKFVSEDNDKYEYHLKKDAITKLN